jgi:hypothetical protein
MIAADQGIYLLSAKFLSLIAQLYHGNAYPLDNLYNIMVATRAAMKHISLLLNEDYTYYSILNTPNILNEVVTESYAAYSGPNVIINGIEAIPPLHRARFESLVLYLLSSLIHTAVAINNMNNNNNNIIVN